METEKVAIRRCMGTEGNPVDLTLKPYEPSVCCDPCGWSQEYPVSTSPPPVPLHSLSTGHCYWKGISDTAILVQFYTLLLSYFQ